MERCPGLFRCPSRGDGASNPNTEITRRRGDGPRIATTHLFTQRGDSLNAATTLLFRQRGFTLIEVLLATVLLAGGLALAMTTLRAATATATRGEVIAQNSERMRAVSTFLRRRIGSSLPVGFATDPGTGIQSRFHGTSDRMRFVADLPDYLGRGGPHLHDIALVDGDGGAAMLGVSFAVVQSGMTIEEREPRPPEPLVEAVEAVRFRYRGLDEEGRLGEWLDSWETADQLPLQVSIAIESTEGGRWPELVIALPQAGSYTGTGRIELSR